MALNDTLLENNTIKKAYNLIHDVYGEKRRASGESYIEHSVATAETLAEWGLNETTIAAGLLHDIAEHADYTIKDIQKNFGKEISFLVDGVTRISKFNYQGGEEQAETIRKMVLAMAQDVRVMLIKLAARKHNIANMDKLHPEKKKNLALRTLEIYAPLANRLGMSKLSGEMEDAVFPVMYPEEHEWLIKNIKYKYEEHEKYLSEIRPQVEAELKRAAIKPEFIDFRAKRHASLYKKLLRYELDIERIYDLVAFRIIVKDLQDCYAVLGVLHELWSPLPGRIKDYIATPKPNGYQSLHTTVIGPKEKIVEFQIRTVDMHHKAENGVAANWAYTENKKNKSYMRKRASLANLKQVAWVEKLRSWQKEFTDPKEFLDSLKIDFLEDRIFVTTPKGDVIDLPNGSTPIDFAYQIHSSLGNECIGAKINGKLMPLDYKLKSQDVVEIIRQKNKKPSENWLNFVVTSSARHFIKKTVKSRRRFFSSMKKFSELKVTIKDKIGLLKEISSVISSHKINIVSINSSQDTEGKFHTIAFKCETADRNKIQKLILRLKKIKEVKEIDYRLL
ncbi:MAG TPA: RelA/SpoT family protein [Candidatus Paceibacterota bacterium]